MSKIDLSTIPSPSAPKEGDEILIRNHYSETGKYKGLMSNVYNIKFIRTCGMNNPYHWKYFIYHEDRRRELSRQSFILIKDLPKDFDLDNYLRTKDKTDMTKQDILDRIESNKTKLNELEEKIAADSEIMEYMNQHDLDVYEKKQYKVWRSLQLMNNNNMNDFEKAKMIADLFETKGC